MFSCPANTLLACHFAPALKLFPTLAVFLLRANYHSFYISASATIAYPASITLSCQYYPIHATFSLSCHSSSFLPLFPYPPTFIHAFPLLFLACYCFPYPASLPLFPYPALSSVSRPFPIVQSFRYCVGLPLSAFSGSITPCWPSSAPVFLPSPQFPVLQLFILVHAIYPLCLSSFLSPCPLVPVLPLSHTSYSYFPSSLVVAPCASLLFWKQIVLGRPLLYLDHANIAVY
jgi:hypothetical protein